MSRRVKEPLNMIPAPRYRLTIELDIAPWVQWVTQDSEGSVQFWEYEPVLRPECGSICWYWHPFHLGTRMICISNQTGLRREPIPALCWPIEAVPPGVLRLIVGDK
jgi:hypothetical protein